ncbi:MAG: hypothetical protein ACI9VR_004282 [Cognaticolwellia sp.]|jgi:hypothetical protein
MKLPAFLRPKAKVPSGAAQAVISRIGALPILPSFTWQGEGPRAQSRLGEVLANALDLECPDAEVFEPLRGFLASPHASDFEHLSDAAARILVFAGVSAARELPRELAAQLGGEVQRHAAWIQDQRASQGPRRVLQSGALVLAGLGWPDLPGASRWWSAGLADLGHSFPNGLHPDGGPREGSATLLLRQVQLLWVVAQVCEKASVALPAGLISSLSAASIFVRDLGTGGAMPSLGADPYEPLLGQDTEWPLAQALSRGWTPGVEAPGESKDWVMRPLRESGLVLLHAKVAGSPSRVVMDLHTGQVIWHVGGQAVLVEQGLLCMDRPENWKPELKVARVDGRVAAVLWTSTGRKGEWTRDLRAEGSRLMITDRVEGESLQVRWRFGEHLELSRREKPGQWLLEGGPKVRVTLDTDQATWVTQGGPELHGVLGPGVRHRSRFEV